MNPSLEVISTPADQAALAERDLSGVVCCVFDVLRATSSIVTALANGARSVIPVMDIPEALALKAQYPDALLAGERGGLRIGADLAGGVEFDCGNSPREFIPNRVAGLHLVMTTTNGTRALRAAAKASKVFVGSFLNLTTTTRAIVSTGAPHVVLVGSGTHHELALEDLLACGAMVELLTRLDPSFELCDAATVARDFHRQNADDLAGAFAKGRNGRRLLSLPELAPDLALCARLDAHPLLAVLDPSGHVRSVNDPAGSK